ncbi:hypothetical protein CSOJ01_11600 [Colletotrichum sojae]|uniref:Uncharacterized protein n=1 Tax=Colletotrichum sojae TaxID=2175907 RepID=A0A8H6IWZ4_9PEZI|nr:hypothetical protein CSOJ01_11600 [Colletotrichum sojae]
MAIHSDEELEPTRATNNDEPGRAEWNMLRLSAGQKILQIKLPPEGQRLDGFGLVPEHVIVGHKGGVGQQLAQWSQVTTTKIPDQHWAVGCAGTKDSGLADQPIDGLRTDIPRRRIQGIGAHEASWAATGAPPEKLAAAGGDVGGGPSRKGPEVKRWPRDEALLGAGSSMLTLQSSQQRSPVKCDRTVSSQSTAMSKPQDEVPNEGTTDATKRSRKRARDSAMSRNDHPSVERWAKVNGREIHSHAKTPMLRGLFVEGARL